MSDPSPLANVDWATVAAAAATFIGTIWLTLKGMQKGKEKVEGGNSSITSIVGASLIENSTIRDFTEQLRRNSECMHDHTEALRQNTAAITRQTDLDLIQNRKTDFRDHRDNG